MLNLKTIIQPFFLLIFLLQPLIIQATSYYFYVQLNDKKNTPYSISQPTAYLSSKALERRAFFKIAVDSTDLPVNPQYIQGISDLGIRIHSKTKWLNGVTILLNDSSKAAQVRALPYVKFVQFTGITNENNTALLVPKKNITADYNYGASAEQINQMNGKVLHQNGYKGENVNIAVIDAGFNSVDINPAFQLLRDENRLLGTKDFVNPNSNIYLENNHGALVLSSMAAEMDGTYVGTAPKASYLLIRTEATDGEYPYEPDLWVSGIEFADSAGVDLSTTSLGYTEFTDTTMNYKYSQLDGKTIRASIAANLASKKGIVVLNSAGNEGNKPWKYISVPADAEGIITVGAVTKDSLYSAFSSIGPTFDGRIKPELCATGTYSALVGTNGIPVASNGTSFSTPILAGLVACYLQAAKEKKPTMTLDELRQNLFQSAHLYNNPTNQLGYGIPNFAVLLENLSKSSFENQTISDHKFPTKILIRKNTPLYIPIPESENIHSATAGLYSISGKFITQLDIVNNSISIASNEFAEGIYILKITKHYR